MTEQAFQTQIARVAQEAAVAALAPPRKGIVSAYDPNTFTAKCLIQPENTESGWLPIVTPWAGNGWGFFAPPSVGDQVDVIFQEGDAQSGVILGGVFSDVDRPLPVPSGELWAVHRLGGKVQLTNDGHVKIISAVAVDVTAPVINLN